MLLIVASLRREWLSSRHLSVTLCWPSQEVGFREVGLRDHAARFPHRGFDSAAPSDHIARLAEHFAEQADTVMLYDVYERPEAFQRHWTGTSLQQMKQDAGALQVSLTGVRCNLDE